MKARRKRRQLSKRPLNERRPSDEGSRYGIMTDENATSIVKNETNDEEDYTEDVDQNQNQPATTMCDTLTYARTTSTTASDQNGMIHFGTAHQDPRSIKAEENALGVSLDRNVFHTWSKEDTTTDGGLEDYKLESTCEAELGGASSQWGDAQFPFNPATGYNLLDPRNNFPEGRVVGVYFDKQRRIWRANWREGGVGKRKTKNFSVDDYGFEEARRLAIQYRLIKIMEVSDKQLGNVAGYEQTALLNAEMKQKAERKADSAKGKRRRRYTLANHQLTKRTYGNSKNEGADWYPQSTPNLENWAGTGNPEDMYYVARALQWPAGGWGLPMPGYQYSDYPPIEPVPWTPAPSLHEMCEYPPGGIFDGISAADTIRVVTARPVSTGEGNSPISQPRLVTTSSSTETIGMAEQDNDSNFFGAVTSGREIKNARDMISTPFRNQLDYVMDESMSASAEDMKSPFRA
eukprot:Blabericola_migrator_1__3404@NODE_1_length_33786_cov_123_788665_g0_i0_p6_GENE_NODE_1_length_33786_cov_123_788665_g0_i0NODE_1_length_33786_cov_123_788665_g0_i0_p6_ORF_typecomplete_len461_score56_84AP2/PF00847_20/7_3e11AP2/PF00847_20/1_8e04_NODE_1_length_33786_cov_123_788665_g0_i016893071